MDSYNKKSVSKNVSKNDDRDCGPIPDRWLLCPRISSTIIAGKFVAFKTPLNARFSPKLQPQYQFQPNIVFEYMRAEKKTVGLWIDLTNTNRFYDRKEVESRECKYTKLRCRGHGETPSIEQTQSFIEIVDDFIMQKPLEYVGVHCTHGFNRTGFLIVAYMVERMDCSVEAALSAFAHARPPGIYKQDYINELFQRYDDIDDTITAPERPTWCLEYDDNDRDESFDEHDFATTTQTSNYSKKRGHDGDHINGQHGNGGHESGESNDGESSSTSNDSVPKKRRRKENATFMAGVQGVTLVTDQKLLGHLQDKIRSMCRFNKSGFPGSQPVSMDMQNIEKLREQSYHVSWKADGTRYMMLIHKENGIYFFDRDNSCFQVSGLRFPCKDDFNTHIYDTLIDGEMVIDNDKATGLTTPRFLVYDIVYYNGTSYMDNEFWSKPDSGVVSRMQCIREYVIEPRNDAMRKGLINKAREPFSVREKAFWDVTQAIKLLQPKFTQNLGHEPDGLIFQPSSDPYKAGQCPSVLKWKPASMNSVDFKLKVAMVTGLGLVPEKVGWLYVGGYDHPFAQIKVSKTIRELDGKIIECKWENSKWVFMRERTDKSFPNSHKTAIAVGESIRNPVTAERLEQFIEECRYREMGPPPSRRF